MLTLTALAAAAVYAACRPSILSLAAFAALALCAVLDELDDRRLSRPEARTETRR